MRLDENKAESRKQFTIEYYAFFKLMVQIDFLFAVKQVSNAYICISFFITLNNALLGISSFLGILCNLALCAYIVCMYEIN